MKIYTGKTVSLVLGSGGARGLTHIGVIHWLEDHGFEISSISGCSIGSLIGGVYAAGKLDEIEEWLKSITKVDMFSLIDFSWDKSGLVKGDKIIKTIRDIVGDLLIEDLPIKFTAVATDLKNEKEVWMNSGKLFDAIRASISIPMFFTPFERNGIRLIDGGVLNPVPIAPTFSDGTDYTIAVNLGGEAQQLYNNEEDLVDDDKKIEGDHSSLIKDMISNIVDRFQGDETQIIKDSWSAYDIMNQSIDSMQSTIARLKLAAYPPDYIVEVARNVCGTFDFHKTNELIQIGYDKAEEALSIILIEEVKKIRAH